jgi:hypothetical protein
MHECNLLPLLISCKRERNGSRKGVAKTLSHLVAANDKERCVRWVENARVELVAAANQFVEAVPLAAYGPKAADSDAVLAYGRQDFTGRVPAHGLDRLGMPLQR